MPMTRPIIDRCLKIDQMLRSKRYPTAGKIAEILEVSLRTTFRLLDTMKTEWGAPIERDAKRKGYCYSEESYALPAIHLTEGELVAVFLAEKVLAQYRGTPYADQLARAFDKLSKYLPDEIRVDLSAADSCYSFRVAAVSELDIVLFRRIAQAVLRRHQVEMVYHTQYRDDTTTRVVDPYHLRNVGGEWYLLGYCHRRKALRIFLISRIEEISETGRHFRIPENFNASSYLAGAFGIVAGHSEDEGPINVVLRFDAWAARYIREKIWHLSQRLTDETDGCVRMVLQLDSLLEIKRWILSWGHHVQVLAPEHLVEMVRNEAADIHHLYEGYEASGRDDHGKVEPRG